jgi:hypothetical protein
MHGSHCCLPGCVSCKRFPHWTSSRRSLPFSGPDSVGFEAKEKADHQGLASGVERE